MNVARVAALLRKLADELEAEDYGDAPSEAPSSPVSRPKRKGVKSFPAPLHPPSDVDRMRAKKMLRRRGIYT